MTTTCPVEVLGTDSLSCIFSYLHWKDILKARVCKKWQEATRLTQVPRSDAVFNTSWHIPELYVRNRDFACALEWISIALPRVPMLNFNFSLGKTEEFDIADGENPEPSLSLNYEELGIPPPPPPVDLHSIANFHDLRYLNFQSARLNGSYPFFFQFQNLECLELVNSGRIKCDLADLAGLPNLKKLRVVNNLRWTGNLESVRFLKKTLVSLCLVGCEEIQGSIHDLADFPLLEDVDVNRTRVTGDIRIIGPDDFVSLKELEVGDEVYGGGDIELISDAESIMLARYLLKKRNPSLFRSRRWRLKDDSPDRYQVHGHHSREPPFWLEFVEAGPRIGWRWTNAVSGGSCETMWLNSEPSPSDEGYEEYMQELHRIKNDVDFYRGFERPPTRPQHEELCASIPLDPILQRFGNHQDFFDDFYDSDESDEW